MKTKIASIITRDYAERYARYIGASKKAIETIKKARFVSSFEFFSESGKMFLSIGGTDIIRIK